MHQPELAGKRISKWGEGPIWHPGKGVLYYVDIEDHQVVSFDPETKHEQSWPVGERVGTVVPRKNSDELVIAGDHGYHFLDPADGKIEPISDPEKDIETQRFNDGKCSPDGRFFAGTISLVKNPSAALYRLDADLSVTRILEGVTNSNGIAWSTDGNTCYYIDTPTRKVDAFNYDASSGSLTKRRSVIDTNPIVDASPDGMAIDVNGRLWIAFCHGGCVVCFDPETGQAVETINFPCVETTAVAFGGPNMTDLYVTTGIHATKQEEHAGRLFVVRNLGVKGAPQAFFAG